MNIPRDVLEVEALEAISADLYYDLLDALDSTSDYELQCIISNKL